MTATQLLISDRLLYYSRISATIKPSELVKPYRRIDKSKKFIDGFFHDEGGVACKLAWIAELASAFI